MRAALILFIFFASSSARAYLCISHSSCEEAGANPGSSIPSKGSAVRINPAAVPTEVGYGIETIYYKNDFDFVLIKGLGRVGAAISPSNTEETFFGAPGMETSQDLYERKRNQDKFKSVKFTLAGAFNIYDNKRRDFTKFTLNLGVLAKYNRDLNEVSPGAGLSAVLGPFSLGYAAYGDSSSVVTNVQPPLVTTTTYRYTVETFSVGLFLQSLLLDYSVLRENTVGSPTVSVATGSLILNRAILTAAYRSEKSPRPIFNYSTQMLETKEVKADGFGGVQFRFTPSFMVGAFYNYYLVRELSASATLFF